MLKRCHLFSINLWVVLVPWILLSPAIFLGKTIYWGTVSLQFLPWKTYAWEMLRSGVLPLWNPLLGMGSPLLANYQSALLYPGTWFTWLAYALGGLQWAGWSMGVVTAANLSLAGFGASRLARQLGIGNLGQVISGLSYGLGGYMVSRSLFPSINAAAAWTPWIILAVDKLISDTRKSRPVLALAFTFGLQLLAGHAQTSWYTISLAFIWLLVRGFSVKYGQGSAMKEIGSIQKLTGITRLMGLFIISIFLAVVITAAQVFPTAEYLFESQRSGSVDYEFASTYSFWPWRFVTLFAPDMFGSPVRGDFRGYGNYWEDNVYIGLLPILLAIIYAGKIIFRRVKNAISKRSHGNQKQNEQMTFFLAVVTIISFWIALGKHTPLFGWLYHNVPTFDMFQAPARFTLWAELSLAILAGYGCEDWRRPEGRSLYWSRLAVAGACAITLGSGLAWWVLGDISPSFIRATALTGVLAIFASLLHLAAPKSLAEKDNDLPKQIPVWSFAVVVLVSADLLWNTWGLNPVFDRKFLGSDSKAILEVKESLSDKRILMPDDVETTIKFTRYMRFDTFRPEGGWSKLRTSLLPNLNLLDQIAMVNNFDPLVPGKYERWMEAYHDAKTGGKERLLDLMGVNIVIGLAQDQEEMQLIYRNSLPLVRWVNCSIVAKGFPEALEYLLDETVNLSTTIVLDELHGSVDKTCSPSSSADIHILSERPDRVALQIRTDQPGWIIRSVTWYPGWKVYVNGQPADLLKANILFQAVSLNPGDHFVEFVYTPILFKLGFVLSITSSLVCFYFWMKTR